MISLEILNLKKKINIKKENKYVSLFKISLKLQ